MKKLWIVSLLLLINGSALMAQKFFTRQGTISFVSESPLEKIEAKNHAVFAILDLETGNLQFSLLVKAFEFKKALMQEHFNENYMESQKFPKAIFKGKIDPTLIDLSKDGPVTVPVEGLLTIHGVEKEISTEATFEIKDGEISAKCSFEVQVADYGIEIPSVVQENIAKTVSIEVDIHLNPYQK